ncbi:hypothetical protein [Siphonobacter sp. SORGH_AS_0500]|uniref:hypothetical protein n=1 Tax=Siphonobacter sp. SORGH_AS_0500 TaxID=1864824 RepID=UPI002860DF86|nr:hypothetical protein [Siphonobacter sp. SORGH_AS_0500]MDR6196136.1 hypothetical protein [Siphonobacter sp. SORGH_AS_0500]
MKLFVSGQLLQLNQDTEIRMQLKSPLFSDEQTGSLSYQFNVPVCPENAQIFGFTHLPGSRTDRRKDYPVELTLGAFRLVGRLQARKVTRSFYECDIVIPAANVSAQVWKRKLKQFDWGTVTYSTFPASLFLFGAELPDFGGSQFQTTIKILKGAETLFSYTYSGISQSLTGEYLPRPFWNDFAHKFMTEVAKMPTDDKPWAYYQAFGMTGPDLRGYRAEGTATGFAMYTPVSGDFKISYQIAIDGRAQARITTVNLTAAETRVINQIPAGENIMRNDERYCMPVIKNLGWYDESNKAWNGYINALVQTISGDLGGYALNFEAGTRYSLAPAIYLQWAIKKTCEILGYRLIDKVFTDDELKKLIIWVNRSLDMKIPNTVSTWNQYVDSWKIGDHLPDLTMKEWVNRFGQNLFFKPVFYPGRKECVIVFLRDVVNSRNVTDWTSKMLKSRQIETADLAPVQASFSLDSADELSKKETSLFTPVPTDAIVDAQEDKLYQKLEMPFSPMLVEKKTVFINKTDPNSPYYSRQWNRETMEISINPIVKQKGISPLYEQQEVSLSPGRIMFYVPDRTIPNPLAPVRGGDDYPAYRITTADIETENYSLQLDGKKGVIETFGRSWMQFLEKPQTEKYQLMLDSLDLANFRWEQKYYMNGFQYLVEMIDVTFTQKGIVSASEVTCRRVPSQI